MYVKVGLIAATFLLLSSPASACSCMASSRQQIIDNSQVALEGKVVRVQRVGGDNGKLIATIRVTRRLKGNLPREVQVETNGNSAACGVNFEKGQTVRFGGARARSRIQTSLCSQF